MRGAFSSRLFQCWCAWPASFQRQAPVSQTLSHDDWHLRLLLLAFPDHKCGQGKLSSEPQTTERLNGNHT